MNRIVVLALVMILPGCSFTKFLTATLEKPAFTYSRLEIVEVSQNQAKVNFLFSAHNPNEIGLKNVLVSYELFVEGKTFLTGNNINLDLPPKSDTEIKVPAVIVYTDLVPVLGAVTERILSGQKTIPVTINAVFSGKPTLYDERGEGTSFSFEKKLTKTADIPLPLDKIFKGENWLRDVIKNR